MQSNHAIHVKVPWNFSLKPSQITRTTTHTTFYLFLLKVGYLISKVNLCTLYSKSFRDANALKKMYVNETV